MKKLSFLDHLEELRRRLITAILIVVALSILSYPLTDDALIRIKNDVLGEYSNQVIVTTPMEAVMVRLKLSLLLGGFVSVPLLIYQAFRFMVPGLYPKEKKWFVITLGSSFILFTAGALFSYLVLLPVMVRFLLGFAAPIAQPMLMLDRLMSFIVLLIFSMGLIFQWPLIVGILARLGIVNSTTLAEKRRYAIVACFIIGATITDPTFITQIIVAIPMMILYETGIVIARVVGK